MVYKGFFGNFRDIKECCGILRDLKGFKNKKSGWHRRGSQEGKKKKMPWPLHKPIWKIPNISKVLTNLTYFYHFVDEKFLKFQQIWTFDIVAVHRKARKKRRPDTNNTNQNDQNNNNNHNNHSYYNSNLNIHNHNNNLNNQNNKHMNNKNQL